MATKPEGDVDENEVVSDGKGSSGASKSTALSVRLPGSAIRGIATKILGRNQKEATEPPVEVRRIRRGKFFLSRHEQTTFGSVRKPIFEYYCHGVVVGETVPDEDRDGIWCYAAHNDFELIPEFQPPSSWPEYLRTPSGWIPGSRFDGVIDPMNLINAIHNQKRLK